MAQRDDALAAAACWSDDDEVDLPAPKRQAVAAAKATPNSGHTTAALHGEHSLSDDTVSVLLQATPAVDSATKEETPVSEVQTLPAVPVSADWPPAAAMPSLKLVLARMPAQKPPTDLSSALLSCAVAKLATTTTHPQCGLVPAACLCAMSQPAAMADNGVAVSSAHACHIFSLYDDDDPRHAERVLPASGGAATTVASRKRGRHGDLFEDSDSDADDSQAVPPPQPVVHITKADTRAAPQTATASVPAESLASRLGAQQREFAAIAGCLAMQRAEVARADDFLTWMCGAMSAVTA